VINLIPGLLKKFTVWLLRLLDYFGLLPAALLKVSPSTARCSSPRWGRWASRRFSTTSTPSATCRFSSPSALSVTRRNGTSRGTWSGISISILPSLHDERICDGFYFASGLKLMRQLLAKPAVLDLPPEQVVADIN
jgi:hypothetical protein